MTHNDSTALTDKQQYWLKHRRACDASGQTTIDYAKAHGINAKSLYSARKSQERHTAASPAQPFSKGTGG